MLPNGTDAEFERLRDSRKPKDDLDEMFKSHGVNRMEGLSTLARELLVSRCGRRNDNGLEEFKSDVLDELRHL